jgi:hypothetical protein
VIEGNYAFSPEKRNSPLSLSGLVFYFRFMREARNWQKPAKNNAVLDWPITAATKPIVNPMVKPILPAGCLKSCRTRFISHLCVSSRLTSTISIYNRTFFLLGHIPRKPRNMSSLKYSSLQNPNKSMQRYTFHT